MGPHRTCAPGNRPLPSDPLPRIIVTGVGIVVVAAGVLVYLAEFSR